MVGVAEQYCVAGLASSNHLEVCASLKRLATIDDCGQNTVARIQTSRLLQRLSERLRAAGCSHDCCGLSALHGPVDPYLEALC